jgi:hypothetical protein
VKRPMLKNGPQTLRLQTIWCLCQFTLGFKTEDLSLIGLQPIWRSNSVKQIVALRREESCFEQILQLCSYGRSCAGSRGWFFMRRWCQSDDKR